MENSVFFQKGFFGTWTQEATPGADLAVQGGQEAECGVALQPPAGVAGVPAPAWALGQGSGELGSPQWGGWGQQKEGTSAPTPPL